MEGQELVDTPPEKRADVIKRARLVSSDRHAAAAVFFNSITVARGANVHDSSLVVVGGGGLSSAVVGHVASTSTFWWNVWLVFIHVVLLAVAVFAILKAARAVKA